MMHCEGLSPWPPATTRRPLSYGIMRSRWGSLSWPRAAYRSTAARRLASVNGAVLRLVVATSGAPGAGGLAADVLGRAAQRGTARGVRTSLASFANTYDPRLGRGAHPCGRER